MKSDELKSVIKKHALWLRGAGGMCANLRGANLYGANLYGANLRLADLREADLREANLSETDLYKADLYKADLCDADLRETDLSGADLHGANLHRANLHRAYLYEANLRGADLRGADLHGANLHLANLYGAYLSGADLRKADLHLANLHLANLRGAYLSGADLYKADLCDADLRETDLSEANGVWVPLACPSHGAFIGWKKDGTGERLIKLLIPDDADRSSATTNKCRCSKALVLAIENLDGSPCVDDCASAVSGHDNKFLYTVGETVYPKEPYSLNRWEECASGIHFFVDREAAVNYG